MIEKLNEMYLYMVLRIHNLIEDEQGDTNFISIIVVLGIVLGVAIIFMGFRDKIVEAATAIIEKFLGMFSA